MRAELCPGEIEILGDKCLLNSQHEECGSEDIWHVMRGEFGIGDHVSTNV